MKTILLTGCAGFIGSHVLEALLKRGDSVVGIDNFSNVNSMSNISEVKAAVGNSYHININIVDVRDSDAVRKIVADTKFDAIVHLAGLAGVRQSIVNPTAYVDVNTMGTTVLMKAAVDHGIRRFVFASSSSVYGNQTPSTEDMHLQPLSPYAASKAAAEAMCRSFQNCYDIEPVYLRFFTAYGPRNREDMMAYKVIDNVALGTALTVYNDGKMLRDWTFVLDIVDGIIKAVDSNVVGPINLGAGRPTSILEFIEAVENCTQEVYGKEYKCSWTSMPAPKADVDATCAAINRAKDLLGYVPNTSLEAGVLQLMKWHASKNGC